MRSPVNRAYLIIVFVCALCGCGGSGSSQTAKLRVINGGWGVPQDLTVVIDGTTVATGISYPTCVSQVCQTLSTFVTVRSGGLDFLVETLGSTTNIVPTEFQRLDLAPNTQNTFVLGGATQPVGFLFLDDDTPAANSVKLRIAHADPSYPNPLMVWVNSDGSTTGNPTISNVTLGSASSYATLAPGSYIESFAIGCFAGPNCVVVGPTAFTANQNVTVYLLNEGNTHRPLIVADN